MRVYEYYCDACRGYIGTMKLYFLGPKAEDCYAVEIIDGEDAMTDEDRVYHNRPDCSGRERA